MSFILDVQDLLQAADRAAENAVVTRLRLHMGQLKVLQGLQRVGGTVSLDTRAVIGDSLQERNRL